MVIFLTLLKNIEHQFFGTEADFVREVGLSLADIDEFGESINGLRDVLNIVANGERSAHLVGEIWQERNRRKGGVAKRDDTVDDQKDSKNKAIRSRDSPPKSLRSKEIADTSCQ